MEKTAHFIFVCATLSIFVLMMTIMPLYTGARQDELDQERGCGFIDHLKAAIVKSNTGLGYQWIDFLTGPADVHYHGSSDLHYWWLSKETEGTPYGTSKRATSIYVSSCLERPDSREMAQRLARETMPLQVAVLNCMLGLSLHG